MKLATNMLKLGISIHILILFGLIISTKGDDFKEEMFIKPLPPTHLYVYFNFVTLVNGEQSCKYFITYY